MTTAEPDRVAAWRISMRLFGWAIDGDIREVSAAVAEGYEFLEDSTGWDRRQGWLDGLAVSQYGEAPRPARPWAALRWLAEHALRGHMEWPGL